MRQITITAPQGRATQIAEIAFAVGISEVSLAEKRVLDRSGAERVGVSIEIEVSNSLAKAFMDEITAAPFFSREEFSIAVRQPRALISHEKLSRLTRPLVAPAVDIFEELWQFSQVTYGFVGRILIGAILLAYGLVEYKLLFIIAGLLFIPLLPLILSIGFGLLTLRWRLVGQGVYSLTIALLLLFAGGVIVGLLTNPPVQYSDFNSLAAGFLVSLAVGVAAGLATADDVGRREMIGLAATAQIAIIPAWFGLCIVLGFPTIDPLTLRRMVLGLVLNVIAIVIAALATYWAIGIRGTALRCFDMNSEKAESWSRERPMRTTNSVIGGTHE
jgi:hypothetical protein